MSLFSNKLFFKRFAIKEDITRSLLIYMYGLFFMAIPNTLTPYPIGHDTIQYLGNAKLMYEVNSKTKLLYSSPLLPFLLSILLVLGFDMVSLLKIYTIFIYGFIGLTVYYYARKALKWDVNRSTLASILLLSSPASLVTGWQLHSQVLSTCIFFVLITQIKILLEKKKSRYLFLLTDRKFFLTAILAFLVTWSHPIIMALLFFMNSIEFLFNLIKRRYESVYFLLLNVVIFISYIVTSIIMIPEPLRDINPRNIQIMHNFTSNTRKKFSDLISLFLMYYMFLLPFSAAGIFVDTQVLLMLAFPTVFLISLFLNYIILPIPDVRLLMLYQYPLSLFASNGIFRLKSEKKFTLLFKLGYHDLSISLEPRNIAALCILFLIVFQSLNMTGLFRPIYFFANPPSWYPSSLQWSGIAIGEIEDVINVTRWWNAHANSTSLLIVPEGAWGWVKYYLRENLYVAKWHPQGVLNSLILNHSLIVIYNRFPIDIINNSLIMNYFSDFYLMDIKSWHLENAYMGIDFRLQKVLSSGDVKLYRIVTYHNRSLFEYSGICANWGANQNDLIIDIKDKRLESIGLSNSKWFGFRYILDKELDLQKALAIKFDVYLSLNNETLSRPYTIMFYLDEYSMHPVYVKTNTWNNVTVILDNIGTVKFFGWAIFTPEDIYPVRIIVRNVTIITEN